MTRILAVSPTTPEPDVIAEAAAVIHGGGLVAFPTETVYGLGADGLNATAVGRIFAAKERPASDPLILHLADATQLSTVASSVPEVAHALARTAWPGPLTLVLPRAEGVPREVTAGGDTVAVRVPAHPVALALIRATQTPIAAPSANLFSRPSPTSAAHVLEDLRGRVDLVLDGGPTSIGIESTVLSLVTNPPTLLRPGGLPLERIEEMIGPVLLPGEGVGPVAAEGEAAPAPGMLLRHYSPRARLLYLAHPWRIATLRQIASDTINAVQPLGLLLPDKSMAALADLPAERFALGAEADLAAIAARLFAGMRALDRTGVAAILTHGYPPHGLGRALNDRLYRAAEGRVVTEVRGER